MSDLISNIAVCSICRNNQSCGYPQGITVREVKEALDVNGCSLVCPMTKSNKLDTSNGVNLALTASRNKGGFAANLTAEAEQEKRTKSEKINLALQAAQSKNYTELGDEQQ